MLWQKIFGVAAEITSVLSLCVFLGALFIWFSSRKRESSIVQKIRGAGIVNAETIINILKQFKSDEPRLKALQESLVYDKARAEGILEKVKTEIDVGRFSLSEQIDLRKNLLIAGVVLVALAVTAAFVAHQTLDGRKPPDNELQSPTGKPSNNIISEHGWTIGPRAKPTMISGLSSRGECPVTGRPCLVISFDGPYGEKSQIFQTKPTLLQPGSVVKGHIWCQEHTRLRSITLFVEDHNYQWTSNWRHIFELFLSLAVFRTQNLITSVASIARLSARITHVGKGRCYTHT